MGPERNIAKTQITDSTENQAPSDYEKADAIVDINKLVSFRTHNVEEWFLAELVKYIRPYLDTVMFM
jgi:hypothetical protein